MADLSLVSFLLFLLISATAVSGDSLESDRQVLLSLKSYLESRNPTNRGMYTEWKTEKEADMCQWPGIACMLQGSSRVTGINLTDSTISGALFGNFSALTQLISSLRGLYLGNNSFSRDIPETLLNLSNLVFLDLSKNKFGGDIQEIFGRFTQLKYLVLHGNSYVGGINSSNILKLRNLLRLDLSFNNFSGRLPPEISKIQSLQFLVLAFNNFSGDIPQEYGNMPRLQALDLSFNKLTGSLPASFGKLTSLLWLMLANNSLSGEIPREIGNCTSLLWFNVANNELSGGFHPELTKMGSNPFPTFELNRRKRPLLTNVIAGRGECLTMRRWIPANLSQMKELSMLDLGFNVFEGKLPKEIGYLPLSYFNITRNNFSGQIPQEIGDLKCLENLDLSYNNFSGNFPKSLNGLNELSKFNISYNRFISGVIPSTGQLTTFGKESFLGNPLLQLPSFFDQPDNRREEKEVEEEDDEAAIDMVVFYWSSASTYVIALIGILVLMCFDCPRRRAWLRLVNALIASAKSMSS